MDSDLTFWKKIDDLCDEFEAGLKSGDPPTIESCLQSAPESLRRELFLELLALDLEYGREHASSEARLQSYQTRFPQYAELAAQRIAEFDLQRAAAANPTSSTGGDGMSTLGSDPSEAAATRRGSNLRYQVQRSHARGGLGEVYVATDNEVQRSVALKEIRPQFADDEQSRQRFLREGEITGRLEHPGIVPVYGLGQYPDGRPFYVMRFIRGESLLEAIENAGNNRLQRGELRRLLQRFVDVCNTMEYAHSKGVLHRDLKPANIMLGRFGETLVVDWGLAKTLDSSEQQSPNLESVAVVTPSDDSTSTLDGTVMGTPAYMSPEQARGRIESLGPESDVYSLGATLFHLLTGRPPYADSGTSDSLTQAQRGEAPSALAVEPRVPRALDAICRRAMARDPRQRYATAALLSADIERWLADEPVSHHRESLVDRGARWSRRHPGLFVSGGLMLTLAMVGVVIGVLGYSQYKRQQQLHEWELADGERQRLTESQATARAYRESAVGEMQASRFDAAESLLSDILETLPSAPETETFREEISQLRQRATRLDEFRQLEDLTWYLAGAERIDEAELACNAALEAVGVKDLAAWPDTLPTADLTDEQREDLEQDIHRLLILSASLLAKDAILDLANPKGVQKCEQALKILEAAEAHQTSNFVRLVKNFCLLRMGRPTAMESLKSLEPQSATDYFLMAFIHQHIGVAPDDPASKLVISMVERLSGLSFDRPLERSNEYFQRAAELEPQKYWHHFMVAWSSYLRGEQGVAEAAANACLALRPEDARTHALRGVLLTRRAALNDDDALYDQAAAAFDQALFASAGDTWILRARGYALIGRGLVAEGQTEILRAVQLEPLQPRDRLYLDDLLIQTQAPSSEPDGRGVLPRAVCALCNLKLGYLEAAELEAKALLDIESANTVGLSVRGYCHLREESLPQALSDFEAALRTAPREFLPNLGKAEVLEAQGKQQSATQAFERALEVAEVNWQRGSALRGQARTLRQLARIPEAEAADREADELLSLLRLRDSR